MSWLLLAPLLPSPAQAAELVSVDPEGPFDHSVLRVGGFLQPRFTWTPPDEDQDLPGGRGFAVYRGRLELDHQLSAGRGYGLRSAFSLELVPEPVPKDLWLDLQARRWLALRLGQMKPPTGRALLVSERAALLGDRPEISGLTADREVGAALHGSFGRHYLDYEGLIANGEGANRLGNVDDTFLFAGRLVASPWGAPSSPSELLSSKDKATLSLGGSAYANKMGEVGSRKMDSGLGSELFGHQGPLSVQGEVRFTWVDWEDVNIVDSRAWGVYGQLGLLLTPVPVVGEHLGLVGRFEQLDPFIAAHDVPLVGPTDTGQGRRTISAGLGANAGEPLFQTIQELRLTVTWNIRQELEDLPYDNDGLLVATHFGF